MADVLSFYLLCLRVERCNTGTGDLGNGSNSCIFMSIFDIAAALLYIPTSLPILRRGRCARLAQAAGLFFVKGSIIIAYNEM